MRVFVQFAEDYLDLILELCREIRRQLPGEMVEFCGIAIRRKTVCSKIDSVAAELGIVSYDWWNAVERGVLSASHNPERLQFFRSILGDRDLRLLVSCDREIGNGFLSGGRYGRTKLRSYAEADDANRWHYVVGVLDYFLQTFSEQRPDFIFLNEATFCWELAAYMMARHLKIPCLILCYNRVGRKYLITDNPYQRNEQVEELYNRALHQAECLDDVRPAAEALILAFRNQPEAPEYTVQLLGQQRRQATVAGMIHRLMVDLVKILVSHVGAFGTKGFLRQENWCDVTVGNLRKFSKTRQAMRGWIFEEPTRYLDTDYVFYPLHVEPEASTSVLCGDFTNQLAFIEQIAKSMPAGFRLLVKEHAPMLGLRPKGFYERISSIPDCHLITPFADSVRLLKQSRAVCVLAGTAGWEAMLLGKPLIVVGNAEYLGIGEGFVRCENLFMLHDYLREAMNMTPISDEHLVLFVAATLRWAANITPNAVAYTHYGLDPRNVIPRKGLEELAALMLARAGCVE